MGFYDYFVDAGDRHHGEIVVISNKTDSLPIEIRMIMGRSIVTGDRDNNPALLGVRMGDPEEGVQIIINQERLTKRKDAELFYYDRYRNLIPFEFQLR